MEAVLNHNIQRPVDVLVDMARDADQRDRRAEARHPFFFPVSISMESSQYSAFARDISATGIGLLHAMPLSPGNATVTIPHDDDHLSIRSEIMWCRPVGEGWYVSGARFID